ncbi:LOW QUALITY PROTEIN: ras-related protein Rab-44 [Geothlypis trichas]
MSERRAGTKGRRLGSSRRKQLQEGPGQAPAPASGPSEEPPWASEIAQRVQQLLRARDTELAGVVTRSDVQKLQEEGLPCSREELELVFDGLDAAGTGRLGTEEFTAGLRQFLSSQNAAREHRRRKTASRRVRLVLPSPGLERGDSEDSRHFRAFMEQLGTHNPSEEQEIWQLWVKLRQDEPQLLDNLEGFLARMRQRIQEARSEKEALELTLNRRVAEHDKDVQQLCELLEQQIQQEQLRLQQQSMARSRQQGEELQRVLDASEREAQRLVTAQMELERRCRSLQSSQQATSTENQQLQESNRALQQHLQHLHQQLQHTQGHLRTMRATVAWEHMGEPGDRVVAELPIEVPMSPQLSPGKSEKFRSEMRIRLGSQSSESKARSPHQVVWEMLPAETNLSGAPRRASSAEEDPFPEPLKEEGLSDQSSLLREMNDAIAALSKHLKAQALGAPPALADPACHPWDNAEPHTGPEAATTHETTPGVLQETLPGHIHRELLEGDLQEGPGTAELHALDVTQAGGSAGTGHCTAQEPGAEQGESPDEAQSMVFLQGKGAGEEEVVLNVAEHLGQSVEAAERVLMEVEGAGRLQETAWAKSQLLGEAEEVEISQREDLEAGLGPPEAGQEGVAVGQCLAMDEQHPGRMLEVQALGTELQEQADPALELPGKLETELREQLEPQPPSWAEAQVGAAYGGGVPEVTVAPGPGVLHEERARTEEQPQGQTTDSKVLEVLPAPAERAGSEEEEVEEAEPREAEQQLQDVWRLCAPGQAAQRELQEQVSAQGHEGRLHTLAQQPEGETPPVMEPEHTAAGAAEHPKQEVPPASPLHKAGRPGDAGSDQLGVVLRENSLGQRQPLGEQSKDIRVGQREKMREFGEQTSQEGEPSSGEPGAVAAAGAAPQGCPKAALDPDHLYNVLFVGDSHVGKTSFLYRLHADTFNPHLTATVGLDYQIKNLVVDNKRFALRLWDSAGQERYRSMTKQFFRKADGVVLMYDITSEYSFSDVRYWLSCIQEGAEDGVAVLLLGKTDCAAQRQVPTEEGECLAKEHQLMFYECSAASGHNVFESMVSFTRLLKDREDELKNKAEEVPKAPQKKKGCCW